MLWTVLFTFSVTAEVLECLLFMHDLRRVLGIFTGDGSLLIIDVRPFIALQELRHRVGERVYRESTGEVSNPV